MAGGEVVRVTQGIERRTTDHVWRIFDARHFGYGLVRHSILREEIEVFAYRRRVNEHVVPNRARLPMLSPSLIQAQTPVSLLIGVRHR
jgi:hypothetical protein